MRDDTHLDTSARQDEWSEEPSARRHSYDHSGYDTQTDADDADAAGLAALHAASRNYRNHTAAPQSDRDTTLNDVTDEHTDAKRSEKDGGIKIGSVRIKTSRLFGGDKILWIIILALLIFSMLMIFSATAYKSGGTPFVKLINQMRYILLGIVALLVVHFIPYKYYNRAAKWTFVGGLVLTVITMLFGREGAGARRDLVLPLIHISFQPFEILKIGLIMLLAQQLSHRQKIIEHTPIMPSLNPFAWHNNPQENLKILREQTLPILGPVIITCIITFLSVGNSTTMIIGATCLIMLFIGRVRMADIGKMIGVAVVLVGIAYGIGIGRSGTGVSRMSKFRPDMMTKHTRITSDGIEIYDYLIVTDDGKTVPAEEPQSINAKMSIASGRLLGKGPGMSTHRSNLEEAERDFAYAFIIEEYGALGGLVILMLYLWLFFRTIEIGHRCQKAFPNLLVLGLGLMIVLQAMVHMLVSVSLFPITGQQLPLISKGGSSLWFTLMALGMILGVSRSMNLEQQTVERAEAEAEQPEI